MPDKKKYYKFLTKDRKTPDANMSAPEVGEWWPTIAGEPVHCENGYHFCDETQLAKWVNWVLAEIEVEDGAAIVHFGDKSATCGRIRIVREAIVDLGGFAQACAERAKEHSPTASSSAAYAYAASSSAARSAASAVADDDERRIQLAWLIKHCFGD